MIYADGADVKAKNFQGYKADRYIDPQAQPNPVTNLPIYLLVVY